MIYCHPILTFRVYSFLFFCIFFILMCLKDESFKPRLISQHLMERDSYLSKIFLFNMSILCILFFIAFCGKSKFQWLYIILPLLVMGIFMTDANSFLHLLYTILYFIFTFYLIFKQRPYWICSIFLLLPILLGFLIDFSWAQISYILLVGMFI